MSTDREAIESLLRGGEPRSFRSISRELGVSDWLVRKTARELNGDPRPMKHRPSHSDETTEEVSALACWLVCGGIVGFLALAIWAGSRWTPPMES